MKFLIMIILLTSFKAFATNDINILTGLGNYDLLAISIKKSSILPIISDIDDEKQKNLYLRVSICVKHNKYCREITESDTFLASNLKKGSIQYHNLIHIALEGSILNAEANRINAFSMKKHVTYLLFQLVQYNRFFLDYNVASFKLRKNDSGDTEHFLRKRNNPFPLTIGKKTNVELELKILKDHDQF